jgi:hypothetical protein
MDVAVAVDVPHLDLLATRGAANLYMQLLTAAVTKSDNVISIGARELVAPLSDRMQNAEKLFACLGQVIFISGGAFVIQDSPHHTGHFQTFQPCRENVPRRSGIVRDVIKAMLAGGELSKRQKRPFFAYHFQRGINGTDSRVGGAWGSH